MWKKQWSLYIRPGADQDRSGMGFTFMEAFMDEVKVTSQVGKGTCVHMSKKIGN